MLKLRVLTALVAAPAVIAAIFLLPLPALALFLFGLASLGLAEWARLAAIKGAGPTAAYLVVFAVLAAALWSAPAAWPPSLLAACVVWLFAIAVVVCFPASSNWLPRGLLVPGGWWVLASGWLGGVVILSQPLGPWLLVWVFVLVWGADIGAYFAGRRFGRRKLAPSVSPGKTWEGVAGGALLAFAAGSTLVVASPLAELGWGAGRWLGLMAVLTVVSVFGDLFESVLKRLTGVKDSGALVPGHGGVLDRIDSLLAALPVFGALLVQA